MFIWVSHIYGPAQSQNWTLSWSSSLNCISHLGSPSSHVILFLAWSVLSINWGHHRSGGTEGFTDGDSSAGYHSNPLCCLPLPSCKWGSAVPMCISLQLISCSMVWVKPWHEGLLLLGVVPLFSLLSQWVLA